VAPVTVTVSVVEDGSSSLRLRVVVDLLLSYRPVGVCVENPSPGGGDLVGVRDPVAPCQRVDVVDRVAHLDVHPVVDGLLLLGHRVDVLLDVHPQAGPAEDELERRGRADVGEVDLPADARVVRRDGAVHPQVRVPRPGEGDAPHGVAQREPDLVVHYEVRLVERAGVVLGREVEGHVEPAGGGSGHQRHDVEGGEGHWLFSIENEDVVKVIHEHGLVVDRGRNARARRHDGQQDGDGE
jgi:hypothetical protein